MRLIALVFCCTIIASAQERHVPYTEGFDGVAAPALPADWLTSFARDSLKGDFVTDSGSSSLSRPNAVLSRNARIAQWLCSPPLDFSGRSADSVSFAERRSASHTSGVMLEFTTDNGLTFTPLGDTMRNTGSTAYTHRTFALPTLLSGMTSVRFRWHISGDGDSRSTTGTYRLDNIRCISRPERDIAVSTPACSPPFPDAASRAVLSVIVTNRGSSPLDSATVSFASIFRRNDQPDSGETLAVVRFLGRLSPGDSTSLAAAVISPEAGLWNLIAVASADGDSEPGNDTVRFSVRIRDRPGCLRINELMYSPASPEPEWIELLTASTHQVDISRWLIASLRHPAGYPIDAGEAPLPAGSYAVITRDTIALRLRYPSPARLIQAASLPSSFMTNDSDQVMLVDATGRTIDSVPYRSRWGGTHGRSLERKEFPGRSDDSLNWATCSGPDSGTPGRINSTTPRAYDLRCSALYSTPTFPFGGDRVILHWEIENEGTETASGYTVDCFADLNGDSMFSEVEHIVVQKEYPALGPGLLLRDSLPISAAGHGVYSLRLVLSFPEDADTLDNILNSALRIGIRRGAIVINEIQFAPAPGEPEWVECFNTDTAVVSAEHWTIGSQSAGTQYMFAEYRVDIPPGGFFLVTRDSALLLSAHPTIPSPILGSSRIPVYFLNNGGGAVVIRDERGGVLDSVRYVAIPGLRDGQSLERIDALDSTSDSINWGGSTASSGCTPGETNSIALPDVDLRLLRLIAGPVDGNSLAVTMTVRNEGRNPVTGYSLQISGDRDTEGVFPAEVTSAEQLNRRDTAQASWVWKNPRPGVHTIRVRCVVADDHRPLNDTASAACFIPYAVSPLRINEIMFDPPSGCPEYVELLNIGGDSVDATGWVVTDLADTGNGKLRGAIRFAPPIAPGGMAVIAPDTGLANFFPSLTASGSPLINLPGAFSLGNSGDHVMLYDPSGSMSDSIRYDGGLQDCTPGHSLERINPAGSGNDPVNWGVSTDPRGGTPGLRNSLYCRQIPAGTTCTAAPNPFSPDGDGFEDVTVIGYTIPSATGTIRIRIFDSAGRLVRTLAGGEPSGAAGRRKWDGTDDNGGRARMGIYIILLDAAAGGTEWHARCTVVLAVRL